MENRWVYFIAGILLIAVLSFFLSTGIFKQSTTSQPGIKKLQVTVSFYPLYFFSSQIGGDKAEVRNITPAGSEPHDHEPTTQDIARIENSNMLVLNGAVETWGDKIKDNLKGKNVKIVIAGENLFIKELVKNGEKIQDPHVWLDPQLAKKQVQKITEGYVEIDPANTIYYQDNQKKLNQKLDDLDNQIKLGLKLCKQKDIITSHAAFAYLTARYGLNQVAISGLSPNAEPSAQRLVEIANFVKQNNIKYIFFEKLVSPKLSETIANEVGAETLLLDPIEGLSNEDMKRGKDYFTVMQENLKNLQTALECTL
ncbi:zinc ABC transporter substrate-binding protein [Patescibacteria group bacterium]|nr:zinc ABC transporter substrate-binding protein [Patescibacteria group bacterium]